MEQRKATLLSKGDAGYVEVSPELDDGISCAACRWFTAGEGDAAGVCNVVEGDIAADGYSDWYTPLEEPTDDEPDEVEEMPEEMPDEEIILEENEKRGNIKTMMRDFSQRLRGNSGMTKRLKDFQKELLKNGDAFKALGGGYWIAAYTNNFEDLEQEIIELDALKNNVARMDVTLVDKPELWTWHLEGTRHGKALWVAISDHTAYAVGKFDDTRMGKAAERAYMKARPGRYRLSHGFMFPSWAKEDGRYTDINTFEITTLDTENGALPANPFTVYQVMELNAMAISEEKQRSLEALFGSDPAALKTVMATIEAKDKADKSLADMGVRYKDFGAVRDDHMHDGDKSGSLDAGLKAFVEVVTEGQAALLETQDKVLDLLNAMDKRITAAESEFKSTAAELRSVRNRAPRNAEQSPTANLSNDEAGKAKEEILLKQLGDAIWENKALQIVKPEYVHLIPHLNGKQ